MKQRLLTALVLLFGPTIVFIGHWPSTDLGLDAVSAATPGHVAVVGALRSDSEALAEPTSPDTPLTAVQIDDLVRKAVYYSGGLHRVLGPDAEWILVKPGGGGIGEEEMRAHLAVVGSVLGLIHEAAPQARVSILTGAGGDTTLAPGLCQLLSGQAAEMEADILDLTNEEAEEAEVPDGGEACDRYVVPIALLECDAVIDVARVAPGAASAMANLTGLATAIGAPRSADGVLVDLALLAVVEFAVLDVIIAPGKAGSRRLNTVLAGADLIAVDRIAAAIPETGAGGISALVRASSRDLGRVDIGDIKVNGIDVDGTWTEDEAQGQ